MTSAPVAPAPAVANAVTADEVRLQPSEASVRWRALRLTGASYEAALAALPDDPDLRTSMAQALLREGNFACTKVNTYEECGDVWSELAELDPAATYGDPCLRRELAEWSLGQLEGGDAESVAEALVGLVSLREPELELPYLAFELLAADASSDELRLQMMAHAERSLAEEQVSALTSDAAVVRAARELHLDAAVTRLSDSPDEHRAVLFDALADEALSKDTRIALVDLHAGEPGDAITAALIELANGDECELAMHAAEVLADRGDASHLPKRPQSFDLDEHMRAICRIQYDGDETRREARLREWIAAPGVAMVSESSDDYWEETGDPADHATTVDADGTIVERDGRRTRTLSRVAHADVDVESFASEPSYGWSCDATTGTCVGEESTTELRFATVGTSLVLVEVTTHQAEGCGC